MITPNYTIFGRSYAKGLLNRLVAYYKFDSNALDSVGGNNGNIIGTPTFPLGKIGGGIDFGNNNSLNYVDIPDSDDFSFTNGGGNDVPYTISMWVKFDAISSTGNWLISKRGSVDVYEWQIAYYQNNFIVTKFSDNSTYQGIRSIVAPINYTDWYHLAYTDDGTKLHSGMKLYLNGVLLSVTNTANGTYTGMNNGGQFVRIGDGAFSNGLKHKGKIDELGIWKGYALTQGEITSLYNSGIGKTYPFQ